MKYAYSQIDKANLGWFLKDVARATLVAMHLSKGELRGLQKFEISFKYPISVIAGTNGAGKSTLLALAACAYHNQDDGFSLPGRKLPYYTISDFFVQSEDEVPPDGIRLSYRFLYDDWRKTSDLPTGVGFGWQVRKKEKGGKWSNYRRRVERNVVFLGIERVVPHSERSVSRSYKHYFRRSKPRGYEDTVRKVVGRIIGKQYDEFWFRQHSRYRLPHVRSRTTIYSGFNMGAGENALFEIFSTIYAAPEGLLIVIDEIELGLHESAQRRLMDELKRVCQDRHIQVICTTHSPTIFARVPPEGRFYIERHETTILSTGISPEYAAGRLAEQNSNELDIFVEDGIAEQIVQAVLPTTLRRRINILPIGSAGAVIRQMTARFKDKPTRGCIAILDGDQQQQEDNHVRSFLRALESEKDKESETEWIKARIGFLPGACSPEQWILKQLTGSDLEPLALQFQIDPAEFKAICENSLEAEKHRELFEIGKALCLPVPQISSVICRWLADTTPNSFTEIRELISSQLD